jgi:chromosome segregation protein
LAKKRKRNIQKKIVITTQSNDVFISKVILENFLTFQKGEVNFNNSKFVIVVGPNWSGKTTIFQAIKFALGSNERDERYKKWSDFIRHYQKKAMVELHIQKEEELIQLRRTVEGGKSPYFSIKRGTEGDFRRAHAKEIQDLVSDLNINPDNQFSFVSQGKIDSIKELKPTELCTFLEEGIGLRSLREEILQQKNDVLRLNSELNSLKTKKNTLNIVLELLSPKLERLEKKRVIEKQKKVFQDELLWANRNKTQEEIKSLKEEIIKIKVVVKETKEKMDATEKEIAQFQVRINEIELKINECSEKLGEKKFKKKELEAKVQTWQNEKIKKKQELEALGERITEKQRVLDNYKSQKATIDKELNLINKERARVENKITTLKKEHSELKKKIKVNQKFLDEYNRLVTDNKEKLEEIQENERYIIVINDEITQLFQSLKDIENKLDQNKWFLKDPTPNLEKKLDKEREGISSRIMDVDEEFKRLQREREKQYRKLKQLQSSLGQRRIILPTNITILKEEIQKIPSLKNVKGPIIDFLKYDDKLSYSIESVLGESLLYSFIADSWDSFTLLNNLKKKNRAYCNIYLPKNQKISPYSKISSKGVLGYLVDLIKIVDNDIDIKKVLYSKIKNCLVVDNFRTGQEVYNSTSFRGKCVTLKGEQIHSYKYAYETPFTKKLKGFLSAGTQREHATFLEAEIKKLNEGISDYKVKLAKLDKKQNDIFRRKEAIADLLYSFKHKQRITTKKNHLYDKRTDLEDANTKIREEIIEIESKMKKLEAQKQPEFFKWNERVNEIPTVLNEIYENKKTWDEKYSESQGILREIEEKLNNHSNKFNAVKIEYKLKKESFQKADKDAFNIFREISSVQDELTQVKENISKLNDERKGIQEEKSILDKKNIQITLNLEQTNIRFNSVNHEIMIKTEALERINAELGGSPPVIRPIEEIKEDMLKIGKELLKYNDVDESLLVERDQMIDSLKKIDQNQRDLKKDINSAIKAENKMEETYYNKFKTVLNDLKIRINQKFETSLVKQFCSLDIVGDFDNLGVEIKAATSKELVRKCTALSGGQVSLISICLILSLQDIRSTPLCMFDEAAMFLDDKNTEVAYNLIKSTLDKRPIQIIVFLPQGKNPEFLSLAEKLIGVARTGKNDSSYVFDKPKIIKIED